MSERHFPFFRAFFRHPPCRALHRFSGREASAVFLSGPQKPDGLPRARTRPDGSACARTRLHGSACARAGPPDFLCAQRKHGGFPFPPLPDAVSPPYDGCFPRRPFLPEKKRSRSPCVCLTSLRTLLPDLLRIPPPDPLHILHIRPHPLRELPSEAEPQSPQDPSFP